MTHVHDPALALAATAALPNWWRAQDEDKPLIYVTFGSVAASIGLFPGFYTRVVEQLAELPARALLTLGLAGEVADLGAVPPHVHVEPWWPQHDVMPAAAAIVGHGGFGTTLSALAVGVPQVVLPLFSFDQFLNAECVAAIGAGLALVDDRPEERRAGDVSLRGPQVTDHLADSILAILADPRFTTAASEVAKEMSGLPNIGACIAALDALDA